MGVPMFVFLAFHQQPSAAAARALVIAIAEPLEERVEDASVQGFGAHVTASRAGRDHRHASSLLDERFRDNIRGAGLVCSPSESWWTWGGSNSRPPGCKPGALPTELQAQVIFDCRFSIADCQKTIPPIRPRRSTPSILPGKFAIVKTCRHAVVAPGFSRAPHKEDPGCGGRSLAVARLECAAGHFQTGVSETPDGHSPLWNFCRPRTYND
jgi:hypothetical protein